MDVGTMIVVSSDPQDEAFAHEVAAVAGLSVRVVPEPLEAVRGWTDTSAAAVLVDGSSREQYQAFESAIHNTVGLFSDKVNPNAIHWITSLDLQNSNYLFEGPIFGSYVLRQFSDVKSAARQFGTVLRASLTDGGFGAAKLLSEPSHTQVLKFSNSREKQHGVEAVKNFLISAGFKSRIASVIANAVDELLMNAMFDAPVDPLGKQVYANTSRAMELKLEGKSVVELYVGYNGDYVALTTTDLFGSLDKTRLFSHISKRYIAEEFKVKAVAAGAGIGLATIFRSGGSFLFSSEKSVRTEVTVFFRKTENYREFKEQFRFINTVFHF